MSQGMYSAEAQENPRGISAWNSLEEGQLSLDLRCSNYCNLMPLSLESLLKVFYSHINSVCA